MRSTPAAVWSPAATSSVSAAGADPHCRRSMDGGEDQRSQDADALDDEADLLPERSGRPGGFVRGAVFRVFATARTFLRFAPRVVVVGVVSLRRPATAALAE